VYGVDIGGGSDPNVIVRGEYYVDWGLCVLVGYEVFYEALEDRVPRDGVVYCPFDVNRAGGRVSLDRLFNNVVVVRRRRRSRAFEVYRAAMGGKVVIRAEGLYGLLEGYGEFSVHRDSHVGDAVRTLCCGIYGGREFV